MEVPVLLPKVFNYPFTYIHNSQKIKSLNQGDFVIVPFGKKKEIGVVWDKIKTTQKKIKLKQIEKKIPNVRLSQKIIKFINWFSSYNIVPRGMILKMCLGNLKNFDKIKKKVSKHKKKSSKIPLKYRAKKCLKRPN